jgi:predicted MFS family arabinose efflux permease
MVTQYITEATNLFLLLLLSGIVVASLYGFYTYIRDQWNHRANLSYNKISTIVTVYKEE